MDKLRVEDIQIGKRFRKENGDLADLMDSIRTKGLINPITLRRGSNLLLAGGRRLACMKELGFTEITEGEHFRYFDDLNNPVAIEFDENVIRKDFLPSEKIEIAIALEEYAKLLAEERRCEVGASDNPSGDAGDEDEEDITGELEEFEEGSPGETEEDPLNCTGPYEYEADAGAGYGNARSQSAGAKTPGRREKPCKSEVKEKAPGLTEKIAASVGWGSRTLEKAKQVYIAAEENPEKYGALIQEMDNTGSVDNAHQKLSVMKKIEERKKYELCDEIVFKKNSIDTLEIPKFLLKAFTYMPKSKQSLLVKEYGENIYRVKQTEFERAIKSYSKGAGILALSEDELVMAVTDVLELTRSTHEEWPFIQHAKNINYQITQAMSSKNSRVTTMDKLELIMIAMASILVFGHPVFKRAMAEKLFDNLPIEKLEAYETLLTVLDRAYGEKGGASLPVALASKADLEKKGWTGPGSTAPGIDKDRSIANAFSMHEVITDRMDEFSEVGKILSRILAGKSADYKAQAVARAENARQERLEETGS